MQPDLPEVHLAYAFHLFRGYRDYERAQVQLAIARRGLPNNSEAISLAAYMDSRQGNWEKAIQELNEALTLDPRNTPAASELALSFFFTRRFREAEQAFDREIDLAPDQPLLKVEKAFFTDFLKTADDSALGSAIDALPKELADSDKILSWRLYLALIRRDFQKAEALIDKMKRGEDDAGFAFGRTPVPIGCYSILVARLQGKLSSPNADFVETRERLNQKVHKLPANTKLLSQLAVVDALLGDRQLAISEAKRAVEMLPISRDALDGPKVLANLAIVYSWTDELDQAFQTLGVLTKIPNGIYYGDLKLDACLEPIRKDPRFEKLLAQLAPNESPQKPPSSAPRLRTNKPSVRSRPKKISVARLPVTGSDLFGREEDIAFLDAAWANQNVNIVTIVAWAGVGKSTLINYWLRKLAADHYRSAEFVFGWSFYRQAPVGRLPLQMNFLMRLSLGLVIQIHESEPRGRRARDSRSSSRMAELY